MWPRRHRQSQSLRRVLLVALLLWTVAPTVHTETMHLLRSLREKYDTLDYCVAYRGTSPVIMADCADFTRYYVVTHVWHEWGPLAPVFFDMLSRSWPALVVFSVLVCIDVYERVRACALKRRDARLMLERDAYREARKPLPLLPDNVSLK